MSDKKGFFIPKNYDKKFEWIRGISGVQNLVLLPVIAVDFFILRYTTFPLSQKFIAIIFITGLPYILISQRPVRENVPLYQHLLWKLKFNSRQRLFNYRKEGYQNVIQKEPTETGRKIKEVHSRSYTLKRGTEQAADNTGKQSGNVSEGISFKFRANEQR